MEYKTYNFNSFNLYTVKTNKFKNCHMEVVFRNKLSAEEIMARKFLVEMICYTTANYPTQKELSIHLEDLYNISFYGLLSRVGTSIFTTLCFDFLNPKYCEKGYIDNVIDLVPEVIMNPNITNGEFDNTSFNVIQNAIINEIVASKENTKSYAYRGLFKEMDEKSYLATDMIGTKEQALQINPKDLVDVYHKMINEDICDIYIVGDLDMDDIASSLEEKLLLRSIKDYDLSLFYQPTSRNKVQVTNEEKDLNQANLLIGCNVTDASLEQKSIVAYVYNFILGGGSLDTKLAKYLRQDNSLCYTTNSLYQKYDSVIVLYAGIDKANYKQAVNLMKKALKEMTTGIKEEELDNAKRNLITALNMVYDNPSNIVNDYLFRNIADLGTVEERIKKIEEVSIEDVERFAKKVKINTIYMLGGE